MSFHEKCLINVLLLWILFVIYVTCLSCFLVCSLQPCGHLPWIGLTSWLSCVWYFIVFFVTFPCGVLGQVWCLICSDSWSLPSFLLSIMQAQLSSWAWGSIFDMSLHLHPYFQCASSEGTDETAQMHRLTLTFPAGICNMNQILMNKLVRNVDVFLREKKLNVIYHMTSCLGVI